VGHAKRNRKEEFIEWLSKVRKEIPLPKDFNDYIEKVDFFWDGEK